MYRVMIVEDEELILQGIKNIVHWNELELQLVHLDQLMLIQTLKHMVL